MLQRRKPDGHDQPKTTLYCAADPAWQQGLGGDRLDAVTHRAGNVLLCSVELGLLCPAPLAAGLVGKLEAGRVQALHRCMHGTQQEQMSAAAHRRRCTPAIASFVTGRSPDGRLPQVSVIVVHIFEAGGIVQAMQPVSQLTCVLSSCVHSLR